MQVNDIFNGYVRISIEGFYIERIINICKKNQFCLENLDRKSTTLIYVEVKARDFRHVAKIVKNNKCHLKIHKKSGLPFTIRKYRKRKIFGLALIALCLTIIALSKFIWKIEIVGDEDIPEAEILKLAQNEGLDIGSAKKNVDISRVVEKIRAERNDVSWVGIKVSGTNARIEVVKAMPAPELIDEKEFCNIVATKDAVIEKVEAQNGTIQVNKGDEVQSRGSINCWLDGGKVYGNKIRAFNGHSLGKG